MKKVFLLLFLVFSTVISGKAQTKGNSKLYGYEQQVSGGASPDRSLEPGAGTGKSARVNYFIYLATSANSRVYPSELWIDGELYGAQVRTISKTPVLLESNDPALNNRVLVTKTTQKILQLVPTSSKGVKKSAKGTLLAKTNDVVMVYKQNGKFYYSVLPKLSGLESAAMQ